MKSTEKIDCDSKSDQKIDSLNSLLEQDRTKARLDYYLKELDKDGLIQNWQKVFAEFILRMGFFVFGFTVAFLVLKWSYLDMLCREHPIIFWLISVSLSLAGMIISIVNIIKSRNKK